jgi:ACS family glucarate transporter-like MFS transporter
MFVLMMVSYIDRINLSVAARPIAQAYKLNPIEIGYLLSSYLWTYLIVLIPVGIAVDRWGARRVTAGSVALWSVGGAMTGAVTGYGSLLGSRMLLGAGEAASYPAGGRIIREWAPRSERGLASAWLNSGAYAGPALGAIAIGWAITQWGWRQSFYLTAGLGLVVALLWWALYRTPEKASWLSGAEREKIIHERSSDATVATTEPATKAPVKPIESLGHLLRSRTMWGLALAQGCAGYTLYLFMTWLPTYLATTHGFNVLKSSAYSAIPYGAAAVLGLLLGRVSDSFLRRGQLANGGRRKIIATCMVVSSIILAAPFVSSTWIILALISISLTCVSTAMAMNIALTNDLLTDGARAGMAVSILIFGGNTFGLLAPIVTGYAVSATGTFSTAFVIAGALLLAGMTLTLTLTRQPIDTASKIATPARLASA